MKTVEQLLSSHPFFWDMPADSLTQLAGCAQLQVFKANQKLAQVDDDADTFYVIRSGRVAIELEAPPRGRITLLTLSTGEVVGWSWLFPPHRWEFDVRALDTIHTIALDGKCLREKCNQNLEMGWDLMQRFSRIMAERVKATRLQLLDVYGAGQ